nr:cytochrome c oxidase subunit II [Acharax sp. NY-2022]
MGLQDAASPLMEQLVFFHDHAMLILIMVASLVSYMLISLILGSFTCRYILEGQAIEAIWTIVPTFVLFALAFPSLRLLYLMDELNDPVLTIKAVGHQWYWSYEYSDFCNLEIDSYMLSEEELSDGEFRLLDVDYRMIVPYDVVVRLLVTAADVIHSWAVPSLGIKVDAIPGRLNQVSFCVNHPGLFYGQCSEICGANHTFMPIVVEAVNILGFIDWVNFSSVN